MSKQTMIYMKTCAPIFSMLQDERRQEITQLLFEHRELSVTALTEKLSLSRPAVSHHLKILKDSGLIAVEKRGVCNYYHLTSQSAIDRLLRLNEALQQNSSK